VESITDARPEVYVVAGDFDQDRDGGREFYGQRWVEIGRGEKGPLCSNCLSKIPDTGWYDPDSIFVSAWVAAGFENPLTPNNATPNSKPIVKDHPHQRPGKWYALVEINADPTATQEVRDAICDNLMTCTKVRSIRCNPPLSW